MNVRKPFVGGNWKMNTDSAGAVALAESLAGAISASDLERVDVAVCPPFVYLQDVARVLSKHGSPIVVGAQDAYFEPKGAFTGEVSIDMLKDCGVGVVIVGHSERRHVIGEQDDLINKKVLATLAGGLACILAIGETIEQREAGQTDAVNERQLRSGLAGVDGGAMGRLTVAYEPVWAIGTGNTATPADAQAAHARIRAVLADLYGSEVAGATRIQYGGSMKPENAGELMAQDDIDGGLIGGASLKADAFASIVGAAAGSLV